MVSQVAHSVLSRQAHEQQMSECFILNLFLLFFCFLRVMCEHSYYQYDAFVGDGRAGRGGTIVRRRCARAHVQMHPTSDLCKHLI